MLFELAHLGSNTLYPWPRTCAHGALPTVFFDPLYVLRAGLQSSDIVLCHDIGPITHPFLFEKRTAELYVEAYELIRRERPGMVFVSESSRREFTSCFGDDFRFLSVIPLYVRPGAYLGDDCPVPGICRPFLLTVGALDARKNHARVIEAFHRCGLYERGYSYVFCGSRGNSAEEVRNLAESTAGVQFLGRR